MAMARGFPSPRASPKRSSSSGVPLDGNPHRCVGWYIPWTNPFPLLLNLPPKKKWKNTLVHLQFGEGLVGESSIFFPTHIAIWGSKNPLMVCPFPRHHRQQQEVDQTQVPATALDALEGILGTDVTSTSKKVAESTGDQWISRWCPRSIAKLVNITPITIWFIGDISTVHGIINQLITRGAPHCRHGVF